MPAVSAEAAQAAILEPALRKVVPLIAVFDDSPFGEQARDELKLIAPNHYGKVHLVGAFGEMPSLLAGVLAAGFSASILPLSLFPNEPIWCCWFEDYSRSRLSTWKAQREQLDHAYPGRVRWLLFLKTEKEDVETTDFPSDERCTIFLAGEKGAVNRDACLLAQGAVCLLLAGWERFCDAGDLDFHKAMLLENGTCSFVLGVGSSGIDLAYHTTRWSRIVADEVAARWRRAAPAPPLKRQLASAVTRQLIPPRGYRLRVAEGNGPSNPGFVLAGQEHELSWGDGPELQPLKGRSTKDSLRHFLSAIHDTRSFLRAVVLANTEQFVRRRSQVALDRLRAEIDAELRAPESPDGMFSQLYARIDGLRQQGTELAQARRNGFSAGDFEAIAREAQRRVDVLPNLPAAFLRFGVIVIGLTWLFAAPLQWGASPDVGADPYRNVLIGSLALLGALAVAIPAAYTWRMHRALRALDAARTVMIETHLLQVCDFIVEALRGLGSSISRVIENREAEIRTMADHFASRAPSIPSDGLTNRCPLFPDACVDAVLEPQSSQLAVDTHRATASSLTGGVDQWNPELWRRELLVNAEPRLQGLLARTSFSDFLATAADQVTTSAATVLATTIADARQPALPMEQSALQPPVLCIAPPNWRTHLETLMNTQLHFLPVRALVAVSLRPYRRA